MTNTSKTPTGIEFLDRKIGGFPQGSITQLEGDEPDSPTLFALNAIGSCQRNGGVAVFIDVGFNFDVGLAKSFGLNTKDLVTQVETRTEAFSILEQLLSLGVFDLIVIGASSYSEVADGKAINLRTLNAVSAASRCSVVVIHRRSQYPAMDAALTHGSRLILQVSPGSSEKEVVTQVMKSRDFNMNFASRFSVDLKKTS